MRIEMTINGALYYTDVPPMKPLLAVLREDLGFAGPKEGCGEGECGACSVFVDGRLVKSCLVPAAKAHGARIETVEGLAQKNELTVLQQAFHKTGAVQCGYCIPGMVLAAECILAKNPHPTEEDIRVGISGNLCRCTGYNSIVNAIAIAAKEGNGIW